MIQATQFVDKLVKALVDATSFSTEADASEENDVTCRVHALNTLLS